MSEPARITGTCRDGGSYAAATMGVSTDRGQPRGPQRMEMKW